MINQYNSDEFKEALISAGLVKNDNVFIYEKTRTIIAKTGEVLSNDEGSYLKLYNGITHEKNNQNINVINFESTIFDFSKYRMQNIKTLKFNERSTKYDG